MANVFKIGSKLVVNSTDPMLLPRLAADPSSGMVAGDFYYNTTNFVVKFYNGTVWSAVATGVVSLTGQVLTAANVIVGNASNISAAVDTSTVGDILANSVTGLTIKSGAVTDAKVASGISRAKLATGTANRLVYNDPTGAIADLTAITAARALVSDTNGLPVASTVTATELSYLSGVTSSVQTQIAGNATSIANLVTLSGVAANATNLGTFTGSIIPANQTIKQAIQSLTTYVGTLPDPMTYKGQWNASTNTPTLVDGTGHNGDVYRVTTTGSQFTPSISFDPGDSVVYNGTTAKWEKWDMTDAVSSVNGLTGAVTLTTDNIAEGTANKYYTDVRAQTAVGAILANSSKITLTYVSGTPSITANIVAASLTNADISATAAIAATKIADGSVTNAQFQYLSGATSNIQTQLGTKANTNLSNLLATAVNIDLSPGTTGINLGSFANAWDIAYLATALRIGTNVLRLEMGKPAQFTLAASTASYTTVGTLFAVASQKSTEVLYEVTDGTDVRAGKIMVGASASAVGFNDTYAETAPIASLAFQVIITGGNAVLQFIGTSTNACTLKISQKSII